jgi:hypothetical protein
MLTFAYIMFWHDVINWPYVCMKCTLNISTNECDIYLNMTNIVNMTRSFNLLPFSLFLIYLFLPGYIYLFWFDTSCMYLSWFVFIILCQNCMGSSMERLCNKEFSSINFNLAKIKTTEYNMSPMKTNITLWLKSIQLNIIKLKSGQINTICFN